LSTTTVPVLEVGGFSFVVAAEAIAAAASKARRLVFMLCIIHHTLGGVSTPVRTAGEEGPLGMP
jgi:hypothetical protein